MVERGESYYVKNTCNIIKIFILFYRNTKSPMDTTSNDCLFFACCHDDSRHLLSHHVQRFQWIKESRTKITNGETRSSNDIFSISINSLVNVNKLHVKRRLERKAKNTINIDYVQLYAPHIGKGGRNTSNYYV
jgi:hypothetical protein